MKVKNVCFLNCLLIYLLLCEKWFQCIKIYKCIIFQIGLLCSFFILCDLFAIPPKVCIWNIVLLHCIFIIYIYFGVEFRITFNLILYCSEQYAELQFQFKINEGDLNEFINFETFDEHLVFYFIIFSTCYRPGWKSTLFRMLYLCWFYYYIIFF